MIRKCANCGLKIFVGPQGWGYKYAGEYACTYKCMRELVRRDGMDETKKEEIFRLSAEGKGPVEIGDAMGLGMAQVRAILAARTRSERLKAEREATRGTGDTSSVTLRVPPSDAGRLVADEHATNPSPEGKAQGAGAPPSPETEDQTVPTAGKSDLAVVVELMQQMLEIIGKMVGA